jgi:hypothetical protein
VYVNVQVCTAPEVMHEDAADAAGATPKTDSGTSKPAIAQMRQGRRPVAIVLIM